MSVLFCEVESPRSRVLDGETHVYTAPLRDPTRLLANLTGDERERAERFRLSRVRDQFIAARGQLRALLASYLAMPPQAVPLLYADSGKPYLPDEFALQFNLSHTDGLAVMAVGRSRVGVDVERERHIPDAEGLVSRFFSRRECDEFRALPAGEKQSAFLRAWTRKEAVLKAIGRGVQSLDCCDVTFANGAAPILRCLDGDAEAHSRWHLFAWVPVAGYLAAGAVELSH
jgi:4'-phosphopantetheinyl transferase